MRLSWRSNSGTSMAATPGGWHTADGAEHGRAVEAVVDPGSGLATAELVRLVDEVLARRTTRLPGRSAERVRKRRHSQQCLGSGRSLVEAINAHGLPTSF